VNEKGDVLAFDGVTDPPPFSVIVTLVALPEKVFPVTVTGLVPQVLSAEAERRTAGAFMHPHEVVKIPVEVTQPSAFLTER
jgi:hypothetical protein